MPINTNDLKSIGFAPSGKDGVFSKRIHDLVFVEFDTADGFVTLARKHEHPKHHIGHEKEFDRLTLPGRRDTIKKLSKLVNTLEGNS